MNTPNQSECCTNCDRGNNALPGRRICQQCQDDSVAYWRRQREARKAKHGESG